MTSWSFAFRNKYQQYFVPYFQILKGGRLGGRWPPRGGWLLIMILDGFFIGDKSIWRRGEWTTATAAKFNPPKGYNEPIGQTLCQSPLRSYLLPLFLLVSMLDGCKVMYWNPFQQQTICNPLSFLYDYTQPGYFLEIPLLLVSSDVSTVTRAILSIKNCMTTVLSCKGFHVPNLLEP